MLINIILVVIILAVIFFAIRGTVKHFKRESGCCGGGGGTVMAIEPKPLEKIAATKEISIEGMKCKNCSNRVQNALNSMENVNAAVNLKKNTAIVKIGDNVSDEQLKAAIEKLDYKVTGIKTIG